VDFFQRLSDMSSLELDEFELIPSDYESVGGIGFPIDVDLLRLLQLPWSSFEQDLTTREVLVQIKAVMLSAILVAMENHRKDLLGEDEAKACLLHCPLCGRFDAEFAAALNYLGAIVPLRKSLSQLTTQLDRVLLAWRWDPAFRPQDEPKTFLAEIKKFESSTYHSSISANMARSSEFYKAEITALKNESIQRSSLLQELQVAKEMYTWRPLRHQYKADLLELTGIVRNVSDNGDRNLDVMGRQVEYPWEGMKSDATSLDEVTKLQPLNNSDAASRCALLLQRTIPLPRGCLEKAFKSLQFPHLLKTFVESAFLQGFSLTGPFRSQTCEILEEPYLSDLLGILANKIYFHWEVFLQKNKMETLKKLETAQQDAFHAQLYYQLTGGGKSKTKSLEMERARLQWVFQQLDVKEAPKKLTLDSISIQTFQNIHLQYQHILVEYRTARLANMFDTTQAEIRDKLLPKAAAVVVRAAAASVADDADTVRRRQKAAMEARAADQERLKAANQATKREEQKAALKAARKK
jgi:hypothetical protein